MLVFVWQQIIKNNTLASSDALKYFLILETNISQFKKRESVFVVRSMWPDISFYPRFVLFYKGSACWNMHHELWLMFNQCLAKLQNVSLGIALLVLLFQGDRKESVHCSCQKDLAILCSAQVSCGPRQGFSNGYAGAPRGDSFIHKQIQSFSPQLFKKSSK